MKRILNIIIVLVLALGLMTIANATSNSELSATLITQNPDPASSGDTVDVNLQIINDGGKASPQVVGEILPEFPFTLAPGQSAQQIIGELPNYPASSNYKILKYTLLTNKDAIDKSYNLKFRYSDDGGISWVVDTFQVRVTSNKYAQIISVDRTKINPGEETVLTFTINNIGKSPLNNLVFTWSEESNVILPVGTDNTRYIPYLGIGESKDLVYTVVANPTATRGLYNLNLKLTFDALNSSSNSVQSTRIETNAGVLVGGSTDFEVALTDGSSGSTSFSIANIGSNPASSVSVMIPEQTGWKVSGSNSAIIGNLNQGDYTIASFKLQSSGSMMNKTGTGFKGDVPAQNNLSTTPTNELKIQIAYTDTMGKRVLLDKILTVSPQSMMGNVTGIPGRTTTQPGFFSTYWYLIVIILGIIVYFGYKRYKKMKRENPKLKLKDFFGDKGSK